MKVNRGKDLEDQFKTQIEYLQSVSLDRLPDPSGGFLGVRNICDFTAYKYPFEYFIECKAFSGNTLNFKSAITSNQWQGMTEKMKVEGVMAGVLVWFIDYDRTVYVPILELVKLRDSGSKSLNIKDIQEMNVNYIEMEGKKKRVFFVYDMEKFVEELQNYTAIYWGLEDVRNGGDKIE